MNVPTFAATATATATATGISSCKNHLLEMFQIPKDSGTLSAALSLTHRAAMQNDGIFGVSRSATARREQAPEKKDSNNSER